MGKQDRVKAYWIGKNRTYPEQGTAGTVETAEEHLNPRSPEYGAYVFIPEGEETGEYCGLQDFVTEANYPDYLESQKEEPGPEHNLNSYQVLEEIVKIVIQFRYSDLPFFVPGPDGFYYFMDMEDGIIDGPLTLEDVHKVSDQFNRKNGIGHRVNVPAPGDEPLEDFLPDYIVKADGDSMLGSPEAVEAYRKRTPFYRDPRDPLLGEDNPEYEAWLDGVNTPPASEY